MLASSSAEGYTSAGDAITAALTRCMDQVPTFSIENSVAPLMDQVSEKFFLRLKRKVTQLLFNSKPKLRLGILWN